MVIRDMVSTPKFNRKGSVRREGNIFKYRISKDYQRVGIKKVL